MFVCRQGRCRRVAGNQDGSKGTARMEHTAMSEVTGRQGSREHGLAAMTYLVICLAAKSCHHPLSTLAQVYRGKAIRAYSVGVDIALITSGT